MPPVLPGYNTSRPELSVEDWGILNGICPYFTMFPLSFPMRVLGKRKRTDKWLLDPFVGRGTSLVAARSVGLGGIGLDSSPVAAAIAQAKVASSTPAQILSAARAILEDSRQTTVPEGEFWRAAFDHRTLTEVCRLRDALLLDCRSDTRKLLRALVLGILHGPKIPEPSYLSNQCPRTFAPKPRYAVEFWRSRHLRPQRIRVLPLIERKANSLVRKHLPKAKGWAKAADSREVGSYADMPPIDWVITSPPYYGMRTYLPDQWLRCWFLGGPESIEYSGHLQLSHRSQQLFVEDIRKVWRSAWTVCTTGARLVSRFGAISSRPVDAKTLILASFKDSGWTVTTCKSAGKARDGRRQSVQFCTASPDQDEFDIYASRDRVLTKEPCGIRM